jgi:hypothetical protein
MAILANVPEVSASPCAESRREVAVDAAGPHGELLGGGDRLFPGRAIGALAVLIERALARAVEGAVLPALRHAASTAVPGDASVSTSASAAGAAVPGYTSVSTNASTTTRARLLTTPHHSQRP